MLKGWGYCSRGCFLVNAFAELKAIRLLNMTSLSDKYCKGFAKLAKKEDFHMKNVDYKNELCTVLDPELWSHKKVNIDEVDNIQLM